MEEKVAKQEEANLEKDKIVEELGKQLKEHENKPDPKVEIEQMQKQHENNLKGVTQTLKNKISKLEKELEDAAGINKRSKQQENGEFLV
jgi:hypothetical protein